MHNIAKGLETIYKMNIAQHKVVDFQVLLPHYTSMHVFTKTSIESMFVFVNFAKIYCSNLSIEIRFYHNFSPVVMLIK
jgi:hypothetical protein